MAQIPGSVPRRRFGIMVPRKSVLIAAGGLALGLSIGLGWLVHKALYRPPKAPALPPAPLMAGFNTSRQVLAEEPRTYDAIPKPKPKPELPPKGVAVTRVAEAATTRTDMPRPPVQAAAVQPLPVPPGPSAAEAEARLRAAIAEEKLQLQERQMQMLEAQLMQERAQRVSQPGGPGLQAGPSGPQGGGQGPRKRGEWDVMAKGTAKRPEDTTAKARDPQENELIHRAKWALPISPLQTIYRSQTLTGRLLQSISSDIPGQVKIQLTTPVLDKFGWDQTIIPKDSILIASQEGGSVRYGQSRLAIRLEQLEFPSGEIVKFQATVGDQEGANGIKGKVDAHIPQLLLATGLSAVLNIGVRAGTGTPGRGEYFQSPIQESARDIGSSVQRDAQSIVDRELRIPPTITIQSGTFCTINLQENVQFNHPPTLVR